MAFASVALLRTAPLQALDLKQHSLEVELSFVESEARGDRASGMSSSAPKMRPAPSPVVTAVVETPPGPAEKALEPPRDSEVTSAHDTYDRGGQSAEGGSDGTGAQSLQTLAQAWLQSVGRLIFSNAVRHYPAPARQAHLEGTVALAITIDALGRITDVTVKRSSGHAELDSAALASVHAISKVPPPPAMLNWRPRALTLPIVYRLN